MLDRLIGNENKKSENKIAILGDIPILGNLFRYKSHTIEKKNLMVFMRSAVLRK